MGEGHLNYRRTDVSTSKSTDRRRRVAAVLAAGAFLAAGGILTSALFTDEARITARTSTGTFDLKVNGQDDATLVNIEGQTLLPGQLLSDVVTLETTDDAVLCFRPTVYTEDNLGDYMRVTVLRTNPDASGVLHDPFAAGLHAMGVYDENGNFIPVGDPAVISYMLYNGPVHSLEVPPIELLSDNDAHLAFGFEMGDGQSLFPPGEGQDKEFEVTIDATAVQHPGTTELPSPLDNEDICNLAKYVTPDPDLT